MTTILIRMLAAWVVSVRSDEYDVNEDGSEDDAGGKDIRE